MSTDFESFLRKHPSLSTRDLKELRYYIALADRLQTTAKQKCGVVPDDIGFELAKEALNHQLENLKEDLRHLPERVFEEAERLRVAKINERDIFYGELLALFVTLLFLAFLVGYFVSPDAFDHSGIRIMCVFGAASLVTIGAAVARRKGYLLM